MTRETLEEYYSIASRIQAIDEEIRILYSPKIGGSGNSLGAGRSSVMISGNPTEETALRVSALKEKLEAELERTKWEKSQLEGALAETLNAISKYDPWWVLKIKKRWKV